MKKILFVCLGNICRSPAAEGIMISLLVQQNLTEKFIVDSAGTGGWHAGQLPDARMRERAKKRDLNLLSRARQVQLQDFKEFDYIAAMDNQNYLDLIHLEEQAFHGLYSSKIIKIMDYASPHSRFTQYKEVPDPYYGGEGGFDLVLDMLQDACSNFLNKIKLAGEEAINIK